jgi:hypothetical protein
MGRARTRGIMEYWIDDPAREGVRSTSTGVARTATAPPPRARPKARPSEVGCPRCAPSSCEAMEL